MQGYPSGTFLLWRVEAENSADYKFYDFVRDYHERDNPHCPPLAKRTDRVTAVLDGQQRLTSLFASLEQASIAHRVNGKKVTKSIQIYFDLDEGQFVANPFDRKEHNVVHKRVTFSALSFITSSIVLSSMFDFANTVPLSRV